MGENTAIDRLEKLVIKHRTQKAAAEAIGISAVYFGDILRGRKDPGPKVLKALGLMKTTVYHVERTR